MEQDTSTKKKYEREKKTTTINTMLLPLILSE